MECLERMAERGAETQTQRAEEKQKQAHERSKTLAKQKSDFRSRAERRRGKWQGKRDREIENERRSR